MDFPISRQKYLDIIESALTRYAIEHNISKEDFKKYGQRITQPSTGKEAFFYKDKCIMTIEQPGIHEL